MNLNDYNYSYANAIGNTLQQPLVKLVCNIAIATVDLRIAKLAFHCLIAAAFVIPAGLSWLLGKSISYFSKTQIDHEGLYLVPSPIQIPEEVESDRSINIMVLSEKYNELNIADNRLKGQTSKKDSFHRMCHMIANEDQGIYRDNPTKRKLFCKQLSSSLKGIIKKINAGEVTKDKERSILMELAEVSTRCYPTWLEAGARLHAEVHGQAETVEIKLLRLIQNYKEFIILEFCQKDANAQWHALNYVRNIVGHELGLNTTLSAHDPYAPNSDLTFGVGLTKWLFLQKYENVNRLISGVQTMINSQEYDASYYKFLQKMIRDKNIDNPALYVTNHFYSEDYKLNEAGANLMLRSIGILK